MHLHVVLAALAFRGPTESCGDDYPVTPEIVRVLRRQRPQVVVVTGWSTFASQAAITWWVIA